MDAKTKQIRTTDGGVASVKALDGGVASIRQEDDSVRLKLMNAAPLRRVATTDGGVALVRPMDSRPSVSAKTLDGHVISVKASKE